MGRNHSNARPRTVARPLPPLAVGQVNPPKTRPQGHASGRAERQAAKRAPSRVEARLYVAVHALDEHMDEIERSVGRGKLIGEHAYALTHAVRRTRASLVTVRARVENATKDQHTHDELKVTLERLRSYAQALEGAAATFVSVARVASTGGDKNGFVRKDAAALSSQLLAGDETASVNARVSSVRTELAQVAVATA